MWSILNPDTRFLLSLLGILLPMLGLGAYMLWERIMHPPRVLTSREGDAANGYWYSSLMLGYKRRTLGDEHPLTVHYAVRTVAEWRRWKPRARRVPSDVKEAMKAMPPPNQWLA